LSIDRGHYSIFNFEIQRYVEDYHKHGFYINCGCITPGIDASPSFDYGVRITRVAAVLAVWKAAMAALALKLKLAVATALAG